MDFSRNSFDCFIRVELNNCIAFVDKSSLSKQQIKQMMTFEPKVVLPKLKIKPKMNENFVNSYNLMNVCKPFNGFRVENKEVLISSQQKRKMSAKCNSKRFCDSNTFDSINENILNDETLKENKNNCNLELSRVIGLPNMGNTCYFNSIIQVLRITPGFTRFICFLNQTISNTSNKFGNKLDKQNKQLIIALHGLFVQFGCNELNMNKRSDNSLNNDLKLDSEIDSKIDSLIKCQNIKDRFEFGQQHDCHEFLNWLIHELNNYAEVLFPTQVNRELNSLYKNSKNGYQMKRRESAERTITFQHFQGVMSRSVLCSECKRRSFTDDSFADIQIPLCLNDDNIDEKIANISELQSFTDIIHRIDFLKDENKFDCNNCSKKTNASVINSIKIPPKVLIIFIKKPLELENKTNLRLKKCNRNETKQTEKSLKTLFKVPLKLEYSSEEQSVKYDLYSFVMHSGSNVNNGHYYTVINSELQNQSETISTRKINCFCSHNVLCNNGWLKVNDNKVQKLNTSHVMKLLDDNSISSTPYLAFYTRID